MKLGNGIEQAIHSVTLLAGLPEGRVLPAVALAEFHGVSQSYLLKHLQALSAAGILATEPGPRGGYRLARAPARISLLDIVLAVEGPEPAFRCNEIRARGPNPLPARLLRKPCGISVAMARAEHVYRQSLRGVSVADILAEVAATDDGAIAARSCAFITRNQRSGGGAPLADKET